MTVRQTIVSIARRLFPSGAGRTLAIALTMVAVAITSTGWSAAAGLTAAVGMTAMQQSAGDDHSAGAHDHGGKQTADNTACTDGRQGCGSSHHQPQDLAQTCCAMACHTAILSFACVEPVSFVTWQVEHHEPTNMLEGAAIIGLERPPRPARA